MRVLHANLARGFRGGERQTLLLAEALQAQGVPSHYLLARGSAIPEHWSAPLPCSYTRRNFPLRVMRGFDVVHAHEAKAVHWAYWNRRITGTPYIITRRMHSTPGRNPFTARSYAAAHSVVCLSRAVESKLRAYDKKLPLLRIPDAYTPARANPNRVRELRERSAGCYRVGNLGALVNRHKGQAFLIEAARKLRTRCPEMRFFLLGEGEDEAQLREQARGLSNVSFLGFQNNPMDWLASFDLFAFPSQREALGSVLLDAMRCGLPIVASDTDGIPDLIQHEQNGLLVPPGDPDALAAALLRLYHAREYARKLGARAAEDAARFSPARAAARYLALYRQAIARPEQPETA